MYVYLLTCYLPAFMVTRKKEKNRQEQEIKYLESPTGGKKKKYHRTKKKKKRKG